MNATNMSSPHALRTPRRPACSPPVFPGLTARRGSARAGIMAWRLGLCLLVAGLPLAGSLPCRAETDVPLAYLRGQHRVVFRVTARGSQTPPAMPEHCTLTYAQRVLTKGTSPQGAYVDLETRSTLPASIDTHVPYPVDRGSLPESLRTYLQEPKARAERVAVGRLLDRIIEARPPAYQDEMVEKILGWVVNNVEYDSSTAIDQTPLAVMQRQTASCAGYAELTVALLREAGIPARRMGCVIPPDCGWGKLGRGGRHAFIETYYSDVGWLSSDPLRSFHFVDPFHLVTRIEGRGPSLGYETLDFKLLEDDGAVQLAALYREPELLRLSAVLRTAGPDTCAWVPYTFRHRRLDGSFVYVGAQGDQVISSRDGRREFIWVWGDREIYDADNHRRFVAAETPWYPPRIVRREARNGWFRFFPDGRREFASTSGAVETRYPDGTRQFRSAPKDGYEKTTAPDGTEDIVFATGIRVIRTPDGGELAGFPNGDRKQTAPDGTQIYFFANGDKQTTYPDGGQLTEWANGTRQTRTPRGETTVERGTD